MQRLERDGNQKSEIASSEIQKSEIKKGYEPIEMAEEDEVSWLDAYVEEEENDLIGWVDYVDWYTTERAENPDLQVHGTSDDVAMIGGVTRIQKSEVTNQECREGFDHWMKSKELEDKEKSASLRAEGENSEVSLDVKLGDDTSPCGAGVMSAGVRKSTEPETSRNPPIMANMKPAREFKEERFVSMGVCTTNTNHRRIQEGEKVPLHGSGPGDGARNDNRGGEECYVERDSSEKSVRGGVQEGLSVAEKLKEACGSHIKGVHDGDLVIEKQNVEKGIAANHDGEDGEGSANGEIYEREKVSHDTMRNYVSTMGCIGLQVRQGAMEDGVTGPQSVTHSGGVRIDGDKSVQVFSMSMVIKVEMIVVVSDQGYQYDEAGQYEVQGAARMVGKVPETPRGVGKRRFDDIVRIFKKGWTRFAVLGNMKYLVTVRKHFYVGGAKMWSAVVSSKVYNGMIGAMIFRGLMACAGDHNFYE